MTIHERARRQFAKTAHTYVTSAGHAKGAELERMVELAGDVRAGRVRAARVLDVATGGGHTALAFARAGADVTATDLTPEMLEAARGFLAEQGQTGVTFAPALAESLPFDDAAFDTRRCCSWACADHGRRLTR